MPTATRRYGPPHDALVLLQDGDERLVREHLRWAATWARPTTVKSRGQALRRYGRAIYPTLLLDADRTTVESWWQTLTTAAITRQCEIGHVSGFYRWAVDLEYRLDDPTSRVRRPKGRDYKPRPMDPGTVRELLGEAPARLRPMLMLMVGCGLRACEVANLTAGDVQRDPGGGGRIFVADGKGGKQRWVPAPQLVIDALAGLPRRGHLFLRQDGRAGPVTPHMVSRLLNQYLHKQGVEETAHALRHTYATRLHHETKDLFLVRDCLGHGSVRTTQVYAQAASEDALRAATASLDALLAGTSSGHTETRRRPPVERIDTARPCPDCRVGWVAADTGECDEPGCGAAIMRK
jgi:integrase